MRDFIQYFVQQNVVLVKIKHLLGLLMTIYGNILGLINLIDGPASPSIRLINPINFRRQSVTNLISNNIHKYESYKVQRATFDSFFQDVYKS